MWHIGYSNLMLLFADSVYISYNSSDSKAAAKAETPSDFFSLMHSLSSE